MNDKRKHGIPDIAAALLMAAVLAFISRGSSTAAVPVPQAPQVVIAAVEQRDLPIQREWVGTLNGLVNAAISAEVTGYLLRQDYSEGSFVHKGQLLLRSVRGRFRPP